MNNNTVWLLGMFIVIISGILFGQVITKDNFVIIILGQILCGIGNQLMANAK